MRFPIHPGAEDALRHLEHLVNQTGRDKDDVLGEARDVARHLQHFLASFRYDHDLPLEVGQPVEELVHRIERASSLAALRSIARDIRQYLVAVSSLARA